MRKPEQQRLYPVLYNPGPLALRSSSCRARGTVLEKERKRRTQAAPLTRNTPYYHSHAHHEGGRARGGCVSPPHMNLRALSTPRDTTPE